MQRFATDRLLTMGRARRSAVLGLALLVVLAWSPVVARATFPGLNGQIAFPAGLDKDTLDLFAINAEGTFARALVVSSGTDNQPAWSPDGRQFAWERGSGADRIRIANADGRGVEIFGRRDSFDGEPAWSPDGRKIAFTSGRDGELYVADRPSGNNVRPLTSRQEINNGPDWSPDGTQIAWYSLGSASDRKHRIFVMNADGSNQRRLFPNRTQEDFLPSWSPDGRRIAWGSFNKGGEVWVANSDGSNPQRIATAPKDDNPPAPVWSPDGKRIAWVQRFVKDKLLELVVAGADGSNPTSVIATGKSKFGLSPRVVDWQPVADRGAQPSSLLRSGGAEDGFGGFFSQVDYPVPGWATNGGLTALRYGLFGFPTAPSLPAVLESARAAQKPVEGLRRGAGKRFFFGGNAAVSTAVQDVDLNSKATEIDTGRASVTLSGLLGGKGVQPDEGTIAATFLNGQGTVVGAVQLGPVTPADRGNQTRLLSRLQTTKLPAGTRRIRVTLTATRSGGDPVNDAYFDNLALFYTKPEATPPTTPPTPVQPPGVVAPGADATAAVSGRISKLKINRTSFAVGSENTATIAQRRPSRGAKISYSLDRATLVTIKINRESAGRREKSGKCAKPTSANRKRKRCTRLTTVATILRQGRAGKNSVSFSGRVNKKALKAASYRVTASAANPVSVRFRIVKR